MFALFMFHTSNTVFPVAFIKRCCFWKEEEEAVKRIP